MPEGLAENKTFFSEAGGNKKSFLFHQGGFPVSSASPACFSLTQAFKVRRAKAFAVHF
jgi:hypothetical protein